MTDVLTPHIDGHDVSPRTHAFGNPLHPSAYRAVTHAADARRNVVLLALAFVILAMGFAGCEEDDDGDGGPAAPEVNFVYVANANDASISGFWQDKDTGALSPMSGSPFNGIDSNEQLIVHPSLTSLFADQGGGGRLVVKGMDPATGELFTVSGGALSPGGSASAYVSLAADGNRLYVVEDITPAFHMYDFNPSTRQFSETAELPADSPGGSTLDATGAYFYTTNSPDEFHSYEINATTGLPEELPGSPINLGVNIFKLVADPKGGFLFGVPIAGDEVIAFEIQATGHATLVGTLSLSPAFIESIHVSPAADMVYVASSEGLHTLSFDPATGNLNELAIPELAGFTPYHAAVTPDGRFLYAAESQSSLLIGFEVQDDGTLVKLDQPDGDVRSTPRFVLIVDPETAQ